MIPKVIHYCWFGFQPLPQMAKKCIHSWKKFLPDYEIKEWNENNFDVNIIPYTTEAYKNKKYAFVSDYARFWVLYHYGGVYFDTDVEVIKPITDILQRGPFMGCENYYGKGVSMLGVAPGLGIGVEPGHSFYKKMLELYKNLDYMAEFDMHHTIVYHTTEMLIKEGLKDKNDIQLVDGIYIYPKEYFCPIDTTTFHLHITSKTRTIHHYAATWIDNGLRNKIKRIVQHYIPERILLLFNKLKNNKL